MVQRNSGFHTTNNDGHTTRHKRPVLDRFFGGNLHQHCAIFAYLQFVIWFAMKTGKENRLSFNIQFTTNTINMCGKNASLSRQKVWMQGPYIEFLFEKGYHESSGKDLQWRSHYHSLPSKAVSFKGNCKFDTETFLSACPVSWSRPSLFSPRCLIPGCRWCCWCRPSPPSPGTGAWGSWPASSPAPGSHTASSGASGSRGRTGGKSLALSISSF